jgi:hypothetical protein
LLLELQVEWELAADLVTRCENSPRILREISPQTSSWPSTQALCHVCNVYFHFKPFCYHDKLYLSPLLWCILKFKKFT